MRSIKNVFFVLISFLILLNFFNGSYLAQTKKNSIIKFFCISTFKDEMLKAGIEYTDEIANETCQCYLEEFVQTASHQNAIAKCKLKAQEKLKL